MDHHIVYHSIRPWRALMAGMAFAALCVTAPLTWAQAPPVPLLRAHAHNDYVHDRPLLDALDHGFCSVEADIYLVDGQLLVAHDLKDVRPERTLQALYLEPLRERTAANRGSVYPNGPRFLLLIDFKSEGVETYAELKPILERYKDMLTTFSPKATEEKAVTLILSGNSPREIVAAEATRFVGIDGRLTDLQFPLNPHLTPLISDVWKGNFNWFGSGPMPEDVKQRLEHIVSTAHAAGCIVRFWGIPPREDLWEALYNSGVDLINADNLEQLQQFLLAKEKMQ
ncbi:MAG: phosphatidylinositol-specific phospholipase C/glycerophosphodiester phosphodiesterase family protein [Candidatus Hydrogenedentes bacterium]|nr:phosphatidylinositol-specific phospholipase C/glycerophosphodiester phosphodiesterase family protein [Candidatus Hydrogenedentota bacterium]